MYRQKTIAIIIPAYNEEKLIGKTIDSVPEFVDHMIVINDGSKDTTAQKLKEIADKNAKVTVITNKRNRGIGYSIIAGVKHGLTQHADILGVIAGDAQCNTNYMAVMIDTLLDGSYDYVKANRFLNASELTAMPVYRRIGNIFITILTKFATGYYSIFDSQNGYGMFRQEILQQLPFQVIGQRYDYENTLLIALSVLNARIKDVAVPAIYGDEVSSIRFFPVAWQALKIVSAGFWKRIYYKYIIYNFHPIALFLGSGLILFVVGVLFGLFIIFNRLYLGLSPSTGTVMLAVLPFLTGFQLTLTALMLDINQEKT